MGPQSGMAALAVLLLVWLLRAADFSWFTILAVVLSLFAVATAIASAAIRIAIF